MFQPNTIRSLLNKRQSSRIGTASTTSAQNQKDISITTVSSAKKLIKSNGQVVQGDKEIDQQNQLIQKFSTTSYRGFKSKSMDPDFDLMIQSKVLLQQVDHEVQKSRMWRESQKKLTQQRLRSNQQIAKVSTEQYLKYLQKQSERDKSENDNIIKKMKEYQFEDQYYLEPDPYDGRIYEMIAQTDSKIEIQRNKGITSSSIPYYEDKHEAFINSIGTLDQIFSFKKGKQYSFKANEQGCMQEKDQHTKINRQALKASLKQIDDQLKQIEDLLKDD